MTAGRPCTVCADASKTRIAAEMIAAGEIDQAIADAIGCSRMAVSRHRHRHVEAPARALAAVASKGRDVREQRERAVAAAERGELDPAAFLSIGGIVEQLRKAAAQLEGATDAAARDGQLTALAQLVGQLHKNTEIRSRLAGHGGFAAAKTQVGIGIGGVAAFQPFVLSMTLGGQTQTMVMGTEAMPAFEVRDGATGQPFAHTGNGGAIVTKVGEPAPEPLIVPKGWQPPADYRPPVDGATINQIVREIAEEDAPDE